MRYNFHDPIRRLQCGLDRVVQSRPIARPHDEAVHDDGDIVVLPPVQHRYRPQVVDLSIDPNPDEAALADVFQHVAELAFAASHQWCQDLDPAFLWPAQDGVGDLGGALPGDWRTVSGTVGNSNSGPEQP